MSLHTDDYLSLLEEKTKDWADFDQDKKEYNPFVSREGSSQLMFPCTGIFHAICVRLDEKEIAKYGGAAAETTNQDRDISRKRGIRKYFRCIFYYKGDYLETCSFTNNISRRCNLFIQFFENPSESMNLPPDFKEGSLAHERKWDPSNKGWGRTRPMLFENARKAVADVMQNYEYNMIVAPPGVNSTLVPSRPQFPNEETWDQVMEQKLGVVVPYEWNFEVPMDHRPLRYQLRPLSNLVTNTGLHLFFVEGTGGKRFIDFTEGKVHPILQPHLKNYIQELQRISLLSERAYNVRFSMLRDGDHPMLPHFPKNIRRFRFGQERGLDQDESYFPIFDAPVTKASGLLQTDACQARFSVYNFSYPSIPWNPNFEQIFDMVSRIQRIGNQPLRNVTFQTQPFYRNLQAQQQMEDAATTWKRERKRILESNLTNPDLLSLLPLILQRPVPYGPLEFR